MFLELKENDTLIVKLSLLESAVRVRLLAADANGLWINAEELQGSLTDPAAEATETNEGRARAVFVPFQQVQYVLKDLPGPLSLFGRSSPRE